MENQRLSDSFVDPGNKTALHATARITGTVSGAGDLFLEGEVNGDITVDGLLFIGENGSVQGKIAAGNMVLAGHVQGQITVKEKIEIRESGHIQGNIVCMKIAIAEGAYLDGEVHTQKGKPITLTYFTEKRADVKNSGR
jgi:cytoskeletal protein CcmA (bactofilin family)